MKHRSFPFIQASRLSCAGLLFLLSGCASLQTYQGGDKEDRDPFEGFNRAIFNFNEGLDKAVLKPVATGYKNVIPRPVRTGISNFFSNLAYPTVIVNAFLQGKFAQGMSDTSRFIANSVFGVLGIFDVATAWELPAHNEDFGQTFGHWGMGEGPYLVLPFFGPSNPRDGIGMVLDFQTDILSYYQDDTGRYLARGVKTINERSNLLSAGRIIDEAALDPYSFRREAYRQRRINLIYDGNQPQPDFSSQSLEDADSAPTDTGNGDIEAAPEQPDKPQP
ncbi:MAG: VacJ family lipoprotein [Gammaproteobacteria bacterium]